jgi:uncharacterized MAPEG superfamily protein
MQSGEIIALELSVVLFLAHCMTQALMKRAEFGQDYMMGARDVPQKVKGIVAARAERALANFIENYPPFIALDLGLIATGRTGGWGAILWIIARIAYLPIYLAGVPIVRSGIWLLSVIGLLMMLARLAGL